MKVFLFITFVLFIGCSSGGSDDDDSENTSGGDASTARGCGVVVNQELTNIEPSEGLAAELVSVQDSSLLTLRVNGESIFVKIQGIGNTTSFDNTAAIKSVTALASEPWYFFPAGENCTASTNGQIATVGQIVTESGKSIGEELVFQKITGVIESSGSCGEELIAGCLSSLVVPGTFDGNDEEGEPVPPCEAAPEDFRYLPSLDDCGGNAGVVLRGELEDAFSVQLRFPNDRDRLDEECGERSCSPYKIQDFTEGSSGARIACFGSPGDAVLMTDVSQVTVKLTSDDHTPERYCLSDPAVGVN